MAIPQTVKVRIVGAYVLTPPLAAGYSGHGEQLQPEHDTVGCRSEQREELPRGGFHGGIRHIVDEPDVKILWLVLIKVFQQLIASRSGERRGAIVEGTFLN